METGSKVAVVTGGASGIGRATAAALAARGYRIALWDRDDSQAAIVSDELSHAMAVHVDVTDPNEVRQAVSTTIGAMGSISVLVAAAAVGTYGPIVDVSDDEWRRVMSTDVDGVFWCLRETAREMKAHGGGSGAAGRDSPSLASACAIATDHSLRS
jgi:NAD(P)-dependent dehydrogenase (short-subunit alcohol dehydrogenase family)